MKVSHQKSAKLEWIDDLEKLPTTSSMSSAHTWNKVTRTLFRQKHLAPKNLRATPDTTLGEPPSINDPSRLIRRSTDRSLAGRNYIPPRSTVQFLPGAYDFPSTDGPSHYSSMPTQVPPGTQAYDFATNPGPPYSQYIPQTEYYPDRSSSAYEPYYQYGNQGLAEADSWETSRIHGVHEIGPAVTPETRRPPPASLENTTAFNKLFNNVTNSAELAEDLETHRARALFEFVGSDPKDLTFGRDDIITVISKLDKTKDWWYVPSRPLQPLGS